MKTLLLVDGSSYLYRAFHAMPDLRTSQGEPVGALRGYINMLRALRKDLVFDYCACVFDAPGRTFRDDLYPQYKANRSAMPEDLVRQIAPIHDAVRALGWPVIEIEGIEADDVIGTLARHAQSHGVRTVVSTGDKDLAQLVNDRVTLVNTMSGERLDVAGVSEKFGVPPERIVDYLTLVGDSVDNVPGVEKVGPKTAARLLAQYGSLDNLIVHADEVKGVAMHGSAPPPPVGLRYETVLTAGQLDAWLHKINVAPLTAVDTETTSLDPLQARLVGVSLSVHDHEGCYIPLAHRYPGAPEQLPLDATLQRLKPWLESERHHKVGQHLKYDQHVFANHGIRLAGIAHDTLLQSYVLEAHRSHDMDSLAERHLGRRTLTYAEVCGKGAGQIGFDQVELGRATDYAAEDAEVTYALHRALWPRIEDNPRLRHVYESLELPVSQVLFEMERTGVLVDRDRLVAQSAELGRRMAELEARAHELAGQPFNLGSPKQVGEILFGKLGLPVVKKTASGAPSTDEEVLDKLALDYPLPKALLEHRALSKLKSTYCDKLPASINPQTGRVHTSYGQAVAVTGRLSSSEPNLQNIPIRTPEGRRIREAFIAPPGSRILSADYSQIELRIMAHISGDEGLLQAFNAGQDVHRATASEVFGVPVAEVTPEQRRTAKVINFGLIYGMSAFGLASNLGIERDAAKLYIDRYFTRYPKVADYMERTRREARRLGYVETVFGRRLWLPEINSPNGPRRAGAERAAINAPMQGTAADLIKLAMIAVQGWLKREQLQARLIMQVHDELVLEVPEAELSPLRAEVPRLMSGVAELKVALVAEVGAGANWDEAH